VDGPRNFVELSIDLLSGRRVNHDGDGAGRGGGI
jgi:hypothetical protein